MKGCYRPYGPFRVAALALSLTLGLLTVAAEAKDDCRVINGGSSADALGEEFPEFVSADFETDGLGEEFPECIIILPFVGALGEEFPGLELILFRIVRQALGEEFPE